LSSGRSFCSALLCLVFCNAAAIAQPSPNSNWLDLLRDLPIVRWFAPAGVDPGAVARSTPPVALCSVSPVPALTDPGALAFENGTNQQGAIDLSGVKPALALALERFRRMVTSVGGTFDLKSAYRPEAYQEHLQEVWFKWMEIRNNHDLGCDALRAQVGEEFARHHLLETQKPVTSSDHTRGLAFDAVVIVPRAARLNRRRVSLDRLTLLAGLKRPDIFHDPVHFKLAVARGARHV
jgi:hypothetical protein